MYQLGHQDLAIARTHVPENGNGGLKTGLDRRRMASSRLSCISEHQKENTPNSEDDCFFPSIQVVKTPSLEPVGQTHSSHRFEGKSRSSGDSFAIPPLQLDSEQTEAVWRQRIHHQLVLPTWRCAAPGGHEEQAKRREPSYSKPSASGASEAPEVRWQNTPLIETRRKGVFSKELTPNITVIGFDGPRSSPGGNSPVDSPSNTSRSPFGALVLGDCMPCRSRSSKSNASSSTDWEMNWSKRKPRRQHNVSESSDRGQQAHSDPADPLTTEAEDKGKADPPKHNEKKDPDVKSCPELDRQSPTFAPITSRYNSDKVSGLESPDYSQFDSGRHQRRRLPDTVSKRFKSLRHRLHRTRSSSVFSARPEFPPPPDGKERRYRSRNSNDIWPSSGEESPIFNTPASNMSPVPPAGHNASLLAATGLMMAAADIDRLTGIAHNGNRPRVPGTKSLELPRPRPSTSADSPPSGSGSSVTDGTLVIPANSPSWPLASPGLAGPTSRLPQRLGRKSRRQPSRLSEVTTPDEINSSTQPGNSSVATSSVFWPTNEPPHASKGSELQRQESTLAQSLFDNLSSPSNDNQNSESSFSSVSEMAQPPPDDVDVSVLALGAGNIVSGSSSLRGRSPEPDCGQTNCDAEKDIIEHTPGQQTPPTMRRPITTPKSGLKLKKPLKAGLDKINMLAQSSVSCADVLERLESGEDDSTMAECGSNSCHPDTWSEDQGEPGDSEPFCPPDCLYSKRCSRKCEP